MDLQSRAHDLMAAVGPALDLLVVNEYEAEGVWHIAVDEWNIVFAELDKARGILVLTADIGSPPPGDRARLYELMLHYNNCWELTYGMRLSIDAPGGGVCLLADLALAGLDDAAFQARLKNFADKAAGWREIITKFVGKSDVNDTALLMSMENLIRG